MEFRVHLFILGFILNEGCRTFNDRWMEVLLINVNLGFLAVKGEAVESGCQVEGGHVVVVHGHSLGRLTLVPGEDNSVVECLLRSSAFWRPLGAFHVLGPMLWRQQASITIRDIVAVGNDEGFGPAVVIVNGYLHGALPNIADFGTTTPLNDFVCLEQVSNKVILDIGDAG